MNKFSVPGISSNHNTIGSDGKSKREVISHRENGLLSQPGDLYGEDGSKKKSNVMQSSSKSPIDKTH